MRDARFPATNEIFSLTFRGPLGAFLGQGMAAMALDAIGEFELFIVPVARTCDGFLYEAVFNR